MEEILNNIKARFHAEINEDFVCREIAPHSIPMAVLYLDGMVSREDIEENIMKPLLLMLPFGEVTPDNRCALLLSKVLPTGTGRMVSDTEEITQAILSGCCAVLVHGCASAILVELQGFDKRNVEQPLTENVVFAPHQAFTESIRTNLTLIHRILHTENLTVETLRIGSQTNTKVALVYLHGFTDEKLVAEVRIRLQGIQTDKLLSTGQLQQLMEEHPFSLLPQMLETERPDRAVSFLTEGLVVVLCDGAPYALAAPAVLWSFLHTPDDHALRWQYGTFLRLVRIFGAALSLLLPAVYNAVLLFHQELLPTDLLTSLMEGYTLVPLSVTGELLIMNFVFDLIGEASLRMPGSMGSALGIVGGLVLGQAAVSANLISPMLIIIVSITGLGLFAVPSYPLSLAVRILRLLLILVSTWAGFAGISVTLLLLIAHLSVQNCFSVPYLVPLAPKMRHNRDIFLRFPTKTLKIKHPQGKEAGK